MVGDGAAQNLLAPKPHLGAPRGNAPRDGQHGPPHGGPLVNGVKTVMVNERLIRPASAMGQVRKRSEISGFALVTPPGWDQDDGENCKGRHLRWPRPARDRSNDPDQRRRETEPKREPA